MYIGKVGMNVFTGTVQESSKLKTQGLAAAPPHIYIIINRLVASCVMTKHCQKHSVHGCVQSKEECSITK